MEIHPRSTSRCSPSPVSSLESTLNYSTDPIARLSAASTVGVTTSVGLASESNSAASLVEDRLFQELMDVFGSSEPSGSLPLETSPPGPAHTPPFKSTGRGLAAAGQAPGQTPPRGSVEQSLLASLLPKEMMGSMVLDALNGFMFLLSSDAKLDYLSDNVEEFLGSGALLDMAHQRLYDFIHPDDRAYFRQLLQEPRVRDVVGAGAARNNNKPLFVRFRVQSSHPDSPNGPYECLQVSVVTVSPKERIVHQGRDLSRARLFCVARKVSQAERKQFMKVEMFSTKVDPHQNYRVQLVDTSGMNSRHTTLMTQSMLNKHLVLDLCHPQDRSILEAHLEASMSQAVVSSIYRMRILNSYMKVKSKSKYYAACPAANNFHSLILSSHSIIPESESMDKDIAPCRADLSASPNGPPPHEHLLRSDVLEELFGPSSSSGGPGSNDSASSRRGSVGLSEGVPINNNVVKTESPRSNSSNGSGGQPDREEDSSKQKDLLLKQLLNVNFNRDDKTKANSSAPTVSSVSSSSSSTNSRILQILSQTNDNVKCSTFGPNLSLSATSIPGVNTGSGGLKRPASSSSTLSSSSSSMLESALGAPSPKMLSRSGVGGGGGMGSRPGCELPPTTTYSSVCKENPALAKLLEKPLHNAVSVPPPVPTKWHQEPRETLPKGEDEMRKFLPPHPAERASLLSSASATATSNLSTSSMSSSPSTSTSLGESGASATVLQPRSNEFASSSLIPSSLNHHSAGVSNHFFNDLDPELSNILDEVIDIQEKQHSSLASSTSTSGPQNLIPSPGVAGCSLVPGATSASSSSSSSSSSLSSSVGMMSMAGRNNSSSGVASSTSASSSITTSCSSSSASFFNKDQSAMADIEHIEKYLASSESSGMFFHHNHHHQQQQQQQQPNSSIMNDNHRKMLNRSLSLPPGTMSLAQTAGSSHPTGVINRGIQSIAGTGRSAPNPLSVASNNNQGIASGLHHMGANNGCPNPVSLVPRMNELFEVVPPNMSLPPTPDIDSLVMIQQRQRRMSSGGTTSNTRRGPQHRSPSGGPNLAFQSLVSPPNRSVSQSQQPIAGRGGNSLPMSSSNNGGSQLLMQQLNSGPMGGNRGGNVPQLSHQPFSRQSPFLGQHQVRPTPNNVMGSMRGQMQYPTTQPQQPLQQPQQQPQQHQRHSLQSPYSSSHQNHRMGSSPSSTSSYPNRGFQSNSHPDESQSLLQKLLSDGSS
ncbi:uncharacterized protein LOC131876871 [Tigriopus californicus]|uniref:uncharacterized protein LOC131876871 n=1 Tax=Tigriopus californicus TaxID=6832 RepID=UPI0027DA9266|nr:uncharacterized protein LOC131876871 [Tigriopus californicus]